MLLRELRSHNWAHFEDGECFCALLESGADVLLVGHPGAGKRKLIDDIKLDQGITIECAILQSSSGVQQELLRHLHQLVPDAGPKACPRSFEAAIRHYGMDSMAAARPRPPPHRKRIPVIFYNADRYFRHNASDFRTFFANYLSFAHTALYSSFALQTVVLSRTDLPLPFPRCLLTYPTDGQLQQFTSQRAGHLYHTMPGRPPQLQPRFSQFVTRCIAFELFFKNFDAMDLVVSKLLKMLKKSYKVSGSDAHELSQQLFFVNCVELFTQNPRRIYSPMSELLAIVQTISPNAGLRESVERAQLELQDLHTDSCNDLPVIARYALLAIRLCQLNTAKGDLSLVQSCRKSSKAKGAPVTKSWQLSRPARHARSWRVWNVMEMLFTAAGKDRVLERYRNFHSAEFYLVFDFLERVGLIAINGTSKFERSYSLTCDVELVRRISQELGFHNELNLDAQEGH